ncbi:TlpA disulfide reductase family protein [Mucilaginibacter flavidus]|uniref:TlpA disulfide reductase family protein n=1 Tax=Mucilaginibacter flavidus TaxID=2949309 RepID=UPI0020927156|nr:TlpA disulfide reductase family protein [Mucilaginibacter flavidus]MCO5948136.1 AhpC/TSA family protein [Mucilaginibacter flavidus]
MKKAILIIAALCAQFSGKLMAQAPMPFTLTGTMGQSAKSSKVYLVYQYEGQKYIDSATVVNRKFQVKGDIQNIVLATLVLDHNGIGLKKLLKTPVDEIDALKFYLHPSNIKLTLKDSVSTAVFTNSPVNQDYARLNALLGIKAEHKLYHLSAQMQKLRTPAAGNAYETYYDSLKAVRRPLLKQFVLQNPKSYIALIALIDYAGPFPDTAEIKPLFKKIDQGLRNNRTGQMFTMLLDSKVNVGIIAPDFAQNDVDGRPVKLSSFRGKYVLVDFWASWCAPCRAENPKLVEAFKLLKGKNFTILGISLDEHDTRAAWIKAIKDDGLAWTQLSDLKRHDNAVAVQYGIRAIPQNVLIDPKGKVIARNIEPTDLVAKIEQLNKDK